MMSQGVQIESIATLGCRAFPAWLQPINVQQARRSPRTPEAFQRDLILAMAECDALPAGSLMRQVAELENVIAAVEAVAGE